MFRSRGPLSLLFILLACMPLFPQDTEFMEQNPGEYNYQFNHLTTEDGFPATSILSVTRDNSGFMWFGTYEGLYRFDGYTYKHFRNVPDDSTSLSAATIGKLLIARDDTLWIATQNGGVNAFNRETEQCTRYMHDDSNPDSLLHNRVNALAEDSSGHIWAGTDGGLNRIDPATGRITSFLFDSFKDTLPEINRIQCLLEGEQGWMWIGTGSGLVLLHTASGEWTAYTNDPGNPASIAHDNIGALARDGSGTLWIGTGDGLDALHSEDNTFAHYLYRQRNPEAAGTMDVSSLQVDASGHVWVGTNGVGLFIFDPGTDRFIHFPGNQPMETDFKGSWVTDIYPDPSGMIWITTLTGINTFDVNQSRFEQYRRIPGIPGSLSSDSLWALLEDSSGSIWIGTIGGGLNRMDRNSQKEFIHYTHDPDDPGSLRDNNVFALVEDQRGYIWAGTKEGLDRFDKNSGKFSRYDRVPDGWVSSLHTDRKGRLWVGYFGHGLYRADVSGGEIVHYESNPLYPGGLSGNRILSITEDSRGYIWLATFGSGINRLDPETGECTVFRHDQNNPGSLSSDQVGHIIFDGEGTMWCATSGGLDRYDPDTQEFKHFRTEDGLPSNNTVSIVEEKPGVLWIGTLGAGISRFDTLNETFINFDGRNGLTGDDFLGGGVLKDRNGKIHFSSNNGLNAFYPEDITPNTEPPPVVLTGFLLFNQPVPIGGEGSPLEKAIDELKQLTLHQSHSMLTFEFSALNYRSPEKNRYAYMLEGFDPDWNYVNSTRRYATYTNLDPGTYTFRLKASNNDGVWNETGKTLTLVIRPYWWNTWWFITLCVAAILSVIGLFTRSRFMLLRQKVRNAEILRESEIRYRELANSITDIFFAIDNRSRCIYWNKASEQLTGIPQEKAAGKTLLEIFPAGSDFHESMKNLLDSVYSYKNRELTQTITIAGEKRVFAHHVYPSENRGVSILSKDITERIAAENKIKKALSEKEILLQELYHRTRNTMQLIQSMLLLRSENIQSEEFHHLVQEINTRIYSMSLVHEMLYTSRDLSRICLSEYNRELTTHILQSYDNLSGRITLYTTGDDFSVSMDTAVPFGLVINELMSNALNHAFPGERRGSIAIHIARHEKGEIEVSFSDDGAGPPEGIDLNTYRSLGLDTISSILRDQLQGSIRFTADNGVTCTFSFPDNLYSKRI